MPIETDDLSEDGTAGYVLVADEATGEVRLLSERCSTCIFRAASFVFSKRRRCGLRAVHGFQAELRNRDRPRPWHDAGHGESTAH
ncbi:hypothetical protein ACFU99_11990 [Streptomyces sp. NPDC057654]|uniref:hypothetical protein n=1 Tax=Streptomyces sp. NPDC057654 TaxID=3346196 RepID=UPI0036BFD4C2